MKRILAFLLALISMLSVLSGCTTEPETETTETPVLTEPATEPITETTEPDTTYLQDRCRTAQQCRHR